MSERFEHHARTVSLLTFFSRIMGLLRVTVMSRLFGAGALADAFYLAFMIPNLFRRLFGEGALSAAFLPVYAQLDVDDPPTARRLASLIISLLVVVLGSITLLGEVVLYLISLRADHSNLAIWLTMVMLPYMPMVCLVAVLGAMLQVHGKFGPTAAAPIVISVCMIASAIGLSFIVQHDINAANYEQHRLWHIGGVALSVVLAGIIQLAWSLTALREVKWWSRPFDAARPHAKKVMQQALPMIVGLGVLQLNTLFDGIIASYPTAFGTDFFGLEYPLREGAMASVTFAQRLYQFPFAVFGIAISTAIFPSLARQVNDNASFVETIRRGLRIVIFIGLPASVGLILVRVPLSAVVLQGGDFTADDTQRVAFVLLGYAPAIWSYSLVHLLTRTFFARGDSRTPVRIAIRVVLLNLILNCSLIWTPLRESGLAWSTAICSVVQVLWLSRHLSSHTGRLTNADVWKSWGKSAVITAIMAALVATVLLLLPASDTWSESCFVLLATVATGAIVAFCLSHLMKMHELKWVLGRG